MLRSIKTLKSRKDINRKSDPWLFYLYVTREQNYNLIHLKSLSELTNKNVLNYVVKSLSSLNDEQFDQDVAFYVEETLKWMDVAKCGTKKKRKEWLKKNYDLYVHNIGSSQIYQEEMGDNGNEVVRILIKTHGLIGQYLKGEVNLDENRELHDLITRHLIDKNKLRVTLRLLNKAIIASISPRLWSSIENDVYNVIDMIINNEFFDVKHDDSDYIVTRLVTLRTRASKEEKDNLRKLLNDNIDIRETMGNILKRLQLWFFDGAFYDFSFEEILKILYMISMEMDDRCQHLSFERIMHNIYFDYNGKRVINVYKRRIIENLLNNISFDEIKNNNFRNQHITPHIDIVGHTMVFDFEFSLSATKLIEFCEIAYGTNSLFNKAVFMLYDLFDFRRDQYDRFYNEIDYLKTMNESLSKKAKILEYVTGKSILDVGPGGGALMDLINEKLPEVDVVGIDISANVIEELTRKKERENKKWSVVKGDALELEKYFPVGKIDTIIYSSIIHELFSYISFNGKKFNHETIKASLTSAFNILPVGGRIIIRDGIMTEDKEAKRIIKFKNKDDLTILDRYCHDFEGRKITYKKTADNEVMMKINDAMEFLYTYTWGENSYSLEVKEQFGYFTPKEYVRFIKDLFGNKGKIVECLHFLQDGYEEHLLEKITIYDKNHEVVRLPDSTCIVVIEKKNDFKNEENF